MWEKTTCSMENREEDTYLQNIFSVKIVFWWEHIHLTLQKCFISACVLKYCWFISATYLFHFTCNLINAFLLSKTSQRTSAEPYEGLRLSLTAQKFWTEDCQCFIFPANHINTTIPFIGIFTVSSHTSKVSAMCIQQQKFTFTTRLTDRKRMWNFRSASTWNLVWILTGVLCSHKEG